MSDVERFHETLLANPEILERLAESRGWTVEALTALRIGWDGTRVTIPVYDADGELVDILRYASKRRPKMIATRGAKRELFPAPETIAGERIIVVEGEPDAIAGASIGLPCVALPGVGKHAPEWAERIARGREEVLVCLDADKAGQSRSATLARAIARLGVNVKALDLGGDSDLTDVLVAGGAEATRARIEALARDAAPIRPFRLSPITAKTFAENVPERNPDDDFLGPLLRRGQRVIVGGPIGGGKTTLCMQMIAAAAYGEPFLAWRGRGGVRCLILDLEQGEGSVARRLRETRLDVRNDNVFIVNIPEGLLLGQEREHAEALEYEFAKGWDVVMLDPFYRLTGNEAREEAEAAMLSRALDRWRMQHGFCMLVPQHLRKTDGRQSFSIDDLYGFNTIVRNAEIVFGLRRVKHGRSELHWWKDRDGDLGVPIPGKWRLEFSRETLFRRTEDVHPGQQELAA